MFGLFSLFLFVFLENLVIVSDIEAGIGGLDVLIWFFYWLLSSFFILSYVCLCLCLLHSNLIIVSDIKAGIVGLDGLIWFFCWQFFCCCLCLPVFMFVTCQPYHCEWCRGEHCWFRWFNVIFLLAVFCCCCLC